MRSKKRLFILCSGLGVIRRGFETIAQRSYENLKNIDYLEVTLFKGGGKSGLGEIVLWNLARDRWLAKKMQYVVKRSPFDIEQASFFLSLIPYLAFNKPDLIFCQEPYLLELLFHWRRLCGLSYKIIHANGSGWLPEFGPRHFDYIQHYSPHYYQECCAQGLPEDCQFMIPFMISVPQDHNPLAIGKKRELRKKLGIPENKTIILSVAALNRAYKRIDYLIEEIAALKSDEVFLVVLGHAQEPDLVTLGEQRLGRNFKALSVDYMAVPEYYQAADFFVHVATREIFGAVILEAAAYGLTCLLHESDTGRFALGDYALFADLGKPGALTALIKQGLNSPLSSERAVLLYRRVREYFSPEALLPKYDAMFRHILNME